MIKNDELQLWRSNGVNSAKTDAKNCVIMNSYVHIKNIVLYKFTSNMNKKTGTDHQFQVSLVYLAEVGIVFADCIFTLKSLWTATRAAFAISKFENK